MTNAAHQVKSTKARAPRCAKCGHPLSRPGTVIPGLGVVGPECEQHVAGRLLHLQRAGLHTLALTGEQRIPAVRCIDGTYPVPEAIATLTTIAARAGRVRLLARLDPAAKEWVITMHQGDLKAFIGRTEGVPA